MISSFVFNQWFDVCKYHIKTIHFKLLISMIFGLSSSCEWVKIVYLKYMLFKVIKIIYSNEKKMFALKTL